MEWYLLTQPFGENLRGLSLAFPYYNDIPVEIAQLATLLVVSIDVLTELRFPKFAIALGLIGQLAPVMTMPVATMHQNSCASAW